MTEARIQDGSINDATDFWQAIMDVGYIMEGENRAYERERMKWLAECLDAWLAAHPEITIEGPLEHFAMHAVRRLVSAFVFNDEQGSDDADYRERLQQRVIEGVGGPDEFATKLDEDENPPRSSEH